MEAAGQRLYSSVFYLGPHLHTRWSVSVRYILGSPGANAPLSVSHIGIDIKETSAYTRSVTRILVLRAIEAK